MSYFNKPGRTGEWYVTGDCNPYDYEEEAAVADADFWTDPEGYVAGHATEYDAPVPELREPPGRVPHPIIKAVNRLTARADADAADGGDDSDGGHRVVRVGEGQ